MNLFSDKIHKQLSTEGVTAYQLEQEFKEDVGLTLELLHAQGLILKERDGRYRYETTDIDIDDAVFCIVDIETNGSKTDKHQIIEIGAVKVQNYTIIDQFESLVQCDSISKHITEITGISVDDTKDAPTLKDVMNEFRLFLGASVFVGHDVKFDYSFTSAMLERVGQPSLMNRKLCTIDLAERTISSYRYGLKYLNEQLELYNEATHHRALSDAITTAKLFKRTLKHVPDEIRSTEQLIQFSKQAKRLKRSKFDPKVL
ncbi:MAG: 3'-5' exonuclease, partial [Sulfurimonadaceae bacterium]|nr:3'-5' exonuclease [Sulfurimonadaceae bacterium]